MNIGDKVKYGEINSRDLQDWEISKINDNDIEIFRYWKNGFRYITTIPKEKIKQISEIIYKV